MVLFILHTQISLLAFKPFDEEQLSRGYVIGSWAGAILPE